MKQLTDDATATAEDIAEGKTAYVKGKLITGTATIAPKKYTVTAIAPTNTTTYEYQQGDSVSIWFDMGGPYPGVVVTITDDNGNSFSDFTYTEKSMSIRVDLIMPSKNLTIVAEMYNEIDVPEEMLPEPE